MQNANNYQEVSTTLVNLKPLGAIVDGTYAPMNCAAQPKTRFLAHAGQYGPNQGPGTGGLTKTCCNVYKDMNLALSSSSNVLFGNDEHGRERYDLLTDRNLHTMVITGNPNRLDSYQSATRPNCRVIFGWRLKAGGEFMMFNAVVVPNSYTVFYEPNGKRNCRFKIKFINADATWPDQYHFMYQPAPPAE